MNLYGRYQTRFGSQFEWSPTSDETGIESRSEGVVGGVMVGDRFRPTDQELVDYYLKRFILAPGSLGNDFRIAHLNVYSFEPSQLPGRSNIVSTDQEWYFISPLKFMDKKNKRFNRKTKTGAWKPTGNPRKVLKKGSKKAIGLKRSLVFLENNVKTEWVMHEYQYIPDSDLPNAGKFVIIKLMRKPDDEIKKSKLNNRSCMNCDNEQQSESLMAADSASSCEIQSSVTELEDGRQSAPTSPFFLEDQSVGKCSPEGLLLFEDQSTNPESFPATYGIRSSLKELKEGVCSSPITPLVLDDQSFNGNGELSGLMDCENDASFHNVVPDQFMIDISEDQSLCTVSRISPSAEGDWWDNDDLQAGINVPKFATSEMGLQTQELMTLSELLDVFYQDPSMSKHSGDHPFQ